MPRKYRFGRLLFTVAAPVALAADPAALPGITQPPLQRAASTQKAAAVPPRMVSFFFGRASCPDGWEPASNAHGRVIVGTVTGGNVAITVGTAMRDSSPTHEHRMSFSVSLASKTISAANGGGNDNKGGAARGARTGSGTARPASSGLPFYRALACRVPLGGAQ
ncbi:MAG: hypothetical protein R2729_06820 [Bryobacteraceae bacterium]